MAATHSTTDSPARGGSTPMHFALALASALGLCACGGKEAGPTPEEVALRQHALSLCGALPHSKGDGCRADVEARFGGCAKPYLANDTNAEAFAACLGFLPPGSSEPPAGSRGADEISEGGGTRGGPVKVLGRCAGEAVVAKVVIELAKTEAWEGASPRTIESRTLYVATEGAITSDEVRSAQLEERDGMTFVRLELSAVASKKLDAMTRTHVGDTLVMTVNSGVQAARIGSPIPGPELIVATAAVLSDICR